MRKIMFAAPASGTGKTAVTCGMLTILARKGFSPCAFKCGPDYIDPMFHRSVLDMESHNLDLFLASPDRVREMFHRYSKGYGISVCEGVMGFYDGVGGTTTEAGAWHLADTLDLPVILVVRPKGASLTIAAQIRGLQDFRQNSHICGVLLNDCSTMLFQTLGPMIEKECGIPVVGNLPHMEEAMFESRHLGLYTAGEIKDLRSRLDAIADQIDQTVDLDRLLTIAECDDEAFRGDVMESARQKEDFVPVRIAVARDEAFCFLYEETLDTLRDAGAELVFFSPLTEGALPEDIGGLYIPGGYPELYAEQLSANRSMLKSVRTAVLNGLPTIAECGGFLYLHDELGDADGRLWPMGGVIHGTATRQNRLVRFGYSEINGGNSMLFRQGESYRVHEFHYWDSDANGQAIHAVKPVSGRSWDEAYATDTLYAGFPHLYLAGKPELAARFVEAARKGGVL